MKLKGIFTLMLMSAALMPASAANPILPLWEHIPDGEPYLFDDPDQPGKKRVYLYGSHDMLRDQYCGTDLVVWSASPDSLDNWRYDGVIFESILNANGEPLNEGGKADVLYAPDVAEVVNADGSKKYYLIPNNQTGYRNAMVAVADRPDGPFKVCNWSKENPNAVEGVFAFDPAMLVDDDGRVYGYWGFTNSLAAEIDPVTMATVKPGTEIIPTLIPGGTEDELFRFFEASSIRKIQDKYVFVYSRWSKEGEWGLPMTNYTLAYAYSDNPLGPYTYGGTIIDGRGRDVDANGNSIPTATPFGNTHGSIIELNGQWWVFYHRQSGNNEYCRQAMVAPIDETVEPGPGGKVTITEGEYTSEGFDIDGLNPLKRYPAAIASHYTGPTPVSQNYPYVSYTGSYMESTYIDDHSVANPYDLEINASPVINNTSGSILGYKYFNFDHLNGKKNVKLTLDLIPEGVDGTIKVYAKPFWKEEATPVGEFVLKSGMPQQLTKMSIDVSTLADLKGKHPLYFSFSSPTEGKSLCKVLYLEFAAE